MRQGIFSFFFGQIASCGHLIFTAEFELMTEQLRKSVLPVKICALESTVYLMTHRILPIFLQHSLQSMRQKQRYAK